MIKWYVGQPVRLRVRGPDTPAGMVVPVGSEGRLVAFVDVRAGAISKSGRTLLSDFDCKVDYGAPFYVRLSNTQRLEPILPEGAAPSEYTAEELFEKLGINVEEKEKADV